MELTKHEKEEAERAVQFMQEYIPLVKKYGICINGCGCCGSPFITLIEKKDLNEYFKHLLEEGDNNDS